MMTSTIKTSFLLLVSVFLLFSGDGNYNNLAVMAETAQDDGTNGNVVEGAVVGSSVPISGDGVGESTTMGDDGLGAECQAEIASFVGCVFADAMCLENCGLLDEGEMNDNMANMDLTGCAGINDQFCSQLSCCPDCSDEVKAYGECTTQSLGSLGITCELDCTSDNGDDTDGGDGDNGDIGDDVFGECQAEIGTFVGCLFGNAKCVEDCGVFDENGGDDMSNMMNVDISSCANINDQFCSQVSCCPDCSDQLEAYGECTTKSLGLDCDIECSGATSIIVGRLAIASLTTLAFFVLG